jgi:uncharacterized protein with ParB-like and HNH nuclease domain
MPFERPLTIYEALESIKKKEYLLPAIQREFVWSTEQIECLFDSLMRNYPIGTFLLWYVEKENIGNFQFYEFIRDFHEQKNRHNPKANVRGDNNIIAVLDGQQRFTALYIGLLGTYAYKLKGKRWDNSLAFPQRKLYLNLLSPSKDTNLEYDFKFLTEQESKRRNKDTHWFEVGTVLNFKMEMEVMNYLINCDITKMDKEKASFANESLFRLYTIICKDQTIHYFMEKDERLDKVLNIFIRVNSGGTPLSYSDLLLSIATAQWKEKDAREEITQFVDEINKIGDGFNFDKDFVLKTCLVLSDFADIGFKVDNFNKKNMKIIETGWDNISCAIRLAVELASNYGYNRDTLPSNTALIPIAYYLLKKGLPHNYVSSAKFNNDRKIVQRWLIYSLLKRAFGATPDIIVRPLRQIISDSYEEFPILNIIDFFRGKPKSLIFTSADVDNFLLSRYGKSYTFSFLALLYPTLDYRNKFHQDHIFPKSSFSMKNLVKKGYSEYKCEFYLEHFDTIANLQLIEGIPNQEKSDKDFKEWLYSNFPDKKERASYMEKHYIPNVDLSFDNFEVFIKERKQLIIKRLTTILDYEILAEGGNEIYNDELGVEEYTNDDMPEGEVMEKHTYRISKKNIKKQGNIDTSSDGITESGMKIILKYLKAKGSPATMKDIKGYMQSRGFRSKTYYDWVNALIYKGSVEETSIDNKKAYFIANSQ